MQKKWPGMAPNGARRIFPTNPDLADILGRTDLNFDNFLNFLEPKFLDFQVPRSPNFWISRPPDLQIPRFPDFQAPRFPDADAGAAGRTLRSQPDPSPNAPRDQIRRKGPCCDVHTFPASKSSKSVPLVCFFVTLCTASVRR